MPSHKRPNNDDESDDERPRNRGHKDLKTKSKSSQRGRDKRERREDKKVEEPKKPIPKVLLEPYVPSISAKAKDP